MRALVGVVLLLMVVQVGAVGQRAARVTGFFSNMHYIPEAGDVVGTEVWLVYARGRYWATVQVAGGEPDPPVVVPVEVSGSGIRFTVREGLMYGDGKPAPDSVLNYKGTVTSKGLLLSVGDNDKPDVLPRRSSYWQ